jgi:hypothetical protein
MKKFTLWFMMFVFVHCASAQYWRQNGCNQQAVLFSQPQLVVSTNIFGFNFLQMPQPVSYIACAPGYSSSVVQTVPLSIQISVNGVWRWATFNPGCAYINYFGPMYYNDRCEVSFMSQNNQIIVVPYYF